MGKKRKKKKEAFWKPSTCLLSRFSSVRLRATVWTVDCQAPLSIGFSRQEYWSGPAPSILYLTLNLDWQFVSYMILYMFQCHSPKSSHPLPLPESKRLLYTSLSLLLSHIQGYRYQFYFLVCDKNAEPEYIMLPFLFYIPSSIIKVIGKN